MLKKLLSFALLAFITTTASMSHAVPINGGILFSSTSWSKDGTTLSVNSPIIVSATGDLTGQSGLTINDLDYSPFTSLDPLWETNNFSFAINALNIVSENTNPDGLVLEGSGILSDKNGMLDDTFGNWSFSGGSFNWSSYTAPAPAILFIMGLGLLGVSLGTMRRKAN